MNPAAISAVQNTAFGIDASRPNGDLVASKTSPVAVSETASVTVPGRPQVVDDLSYIAADLRPLAVPLAGLTADTANARKHANRDLAALVESLQHHGQQKAVVGCRQHRGRRDVIIAGNGTLAAARRQERADAHARADFIRTNSHTACSGRASPGVRTGR